MTGLSGRAWGESGDSCAQSPAVEAADLERKTRSSSGPGPQRSIAPKRVFPLSQGLIKIIILFGREMSTEGPLGEARAGCVRPRYHPALNSHLTPCPPEMSPVHPKRRQADVWFDRVEAAEGNES